MPTKEKKARILMISFCPTGMESFFFDAKQTVAGLPSFARVFYKLLNEERVEHINLILLTNEERPINIPQLYRNKLKVFPIRYHRFRGLILKSILAIPLVIFIGLKNRVNICYICGDACPIIGIAGLILKLPIIRRLYGTFLYPQLGKTKFSIFLRSPLEYLSFALPASDIIITNDGSSGDLVFKKIGYEKARLHFLYNGIEKDMERKMKPPSFKLPPKYISYVARVSHWKRQHLVIEALSILKGKGIIVPLYIVGQNDDPPYFLKLKKIVEEKDLQEQVFFTGGLPAEVTWFILKHSYLTFALYEYSNLGNVTLEALALGVPLITVNINNSLKDIPKDAYYPLQSDNPTEIAETIEKLWNSPDICERISATAKEFAFNFFRDWEERASLEVEIILSHLKA
jgi:glycosyltransferase involved in cell wall biosynthesis